ncbi:MAG: ERCC4 domain-containing protein [Candidatus Anammoxibacter sp.]
MKLKKTDITILVDSREQMPLEFKEAKTEIATLTTGDYSLKRFENEISIERKSLDDLLSSLGKGRERFMKEIQRMRGFEYSALVIESALWEITGGNYRSQISPVSVFGSLQSLSVAHGIHVFWAESRELAASLVEGLLYHYLRKKWKEVERVKHLIL